MSERRGRAHDAVDPDADSADATPEERRALFRVVRGTPTDEELAALTVVLTVAATAAPAVPRPRVRSVWADPATRLRRPLAIGPDAWRTSFRPR